MQGLNRYGNDELSVKKNSLKNQSIVVEHVHLGSYHAQCRTLSSSTYSVVYK